MTELTREKISLVMLAIQALRLTGRIGAHEAVSTERMAEISKDLGCPVSEKSFRNATEIQLAAVRRAMLAGKQKVES